MPCRETNFSSHSAISTLTVFTDIDRRTSRQMDTQTNWWTYLQPLIQDVLHQDQLLLPLLHLHLNSFYTDRQTDRNRPANTQTVTQTNHGHTFSHSSKMSCIRTSFSSHFSISTSTVFTQTDRQTETDQQTHKRSHKPTMDIPSATHPRCPASGPASPPTSSSPPQQFLHRQTDRDKTSKHTNGHTNQPWTYLQPLIQDVLHQDQLLLPLLHLRLKGLDEGRAAHGLRLHNVVVQQQLDVVNS